MNPNPELRFARTSDVLFPLWIPAPAGITDDSPTYRKRRGHLHGCINCSPLLNPRRRWRGYPLVEKVLDFATPQRSKDPGESVFLLKLC